MKFTKDDIAFVYGSKWKQRYFTKKGDDYYPLGAQWDITHQVWRPYQVAPETDWWVAFYPADNMQRPTGPLCDGCHSVNYNIQTKTVTEWNVGCEKCHGPGGAHVEKPSRANIVNPARLDYVCSATTSASSAIRRASRSAIRSTGNTTIGRSAFEAGRI